MNVTSQFSRTQVFNMIVNALLFPPFSLLDTTHLKPHLERPWTKDIAVLHWPVKTAWWFGLGVPRGWLAHSQTTPWEQKLGGDCAKLPSLPFSSQSICLAHGLMCAGQRRIPFAPCFTTSGWNVVQKGTNWELHNPPTHSGLRKESILWLFCSPVEESSQQISPLEFPVGNSKPEPSAALLLGSCY